MLSLFFRIITFSIITFGTIAISIYFRLIKMSNKQTFICESLVDSVITLSYQQDWSQDELDLLITQFFLQYSCFEQGERVLGADREVVYFLWQDYRFSLNFECYSESIWMEALASSSTLLTQIYQLMNK